MVALSSRDTGGGLQGIVRLLGVKVFSGRANLPLADKIARHLGDMLGKITLSNFPDGETQVRIEEDVRGRDVFVVQPTCPAINENWMELLVMPDAFKRQFPAASLPCCCNIWLRAGRDRKDVGRADHGQVGRRPPYYCRRPCPRSRSARGSACKVSSTSPWIISMLESVINEYVRKLQPAARFRGSQPGRGAL